MTGHKNPPLTVDAILEQDGKILMIRRSGETFKDHLALPGGFVDYGESVEHAVIREVKEELNVDAKPLHILGVYSEGLRDPRGHVVSTVFICSFEGEITAGDDASSYEWFHLKDLSKIKLAFDHNQVLTHYLKWKDNRETFWSNK